MLLGIILLFIFIHQLSKYQVFAIDFRLLAGFRLLTSNLELQPKPLLVVIVLILRFSQMFLGWLNAMQLFLDNIIFAWCIFK